MLNLAMDTLAALKCPGGCGQWSDESHDADTDGEWVVDDETICYACAALEQYREQDAKEREPGALIHVTRDVSEEARERLELRRDQRRKSASRMAEHKKASAEDSLG